MQSTDQTSNQDGTQITGTPSTATPEELSTNAAPPSKPNRRMRRFAKAQRRSDLLKARQVSNRRLVNFRKLQDQVDSLKRGGRLPVEQVDLFFKIALNRLFKKDFKKPGEFEAKMNAILHNLRSGKFQYKEMPIAQAATETKEEST